MPPAPIRLDTLLMDFQASECLDEEGVQEKIRELLAGEAVEPIQVTSDGGLLFLTDGFHRVEAALRCGVTELNATIEPGSIAEMQAEWDAGVKRANDENRRWAAENLGRP